MLHGFHLLEADAGTGKTWTISGLVVRALIERGLTIDSILVVTFTRAATAELSRRIANASSCWAQALERRASGRAQEIDDLFCAAYLERIADPATALRRLRVALAQIDEAQVRTIHGFCHGVIDEHAMSIGAARGLKAQALGSAWLERGIAGWWREAMHRASPDVLRLLRGTGVSPQALVDPVRAIDARPGASLLPAVGEWRDLATSLQRLRAELADALATETGALREWLSVKGQYDASRWQERWIVSRLAALEAFCDRGNRDAASIRQKWRSSPASISAAAVAATPFRRCASSRCASSSTRCGPRSRRSRRWSRSRRPRTSPPGAWP